MALLCCNKWSASSFSQNVSTKSYECWFTVSRVEWSTVSTAYKWWCLSCSHQKLRIVALLAGLFQGKFALAKIAIRQRVSLAKQWWYDTRGLSSEEVMSCSHEPCSISFTFWCIVHTNGVSATSSSKNTMLRAKFCKIEESNLLMRMLFFEELIELS